MDLVSKLWNFCHTLRHEGIDYSDYIEELTYLLFLKIADEREVNIPDGCNWQKLIENDGEDLLRKYNSILQTLSKQDGILRDIFCEPIAKIHNSSSLKKLLLLIDEINWSSYNQDILGATFEGLLEKAASESKKGAGQYFTPRPLIETIVRVMQPNPFETMNFKISDVACGTAGFLTSSYEWWRSNNDITTLSEKHLDKLISNTYFGQELVIRPRRLALMNLYLHGLNPNIILGDTIYEPLPERKTTCILTNPPFGTKGANQIPDRTDFPIKTSNKQLNFIQHAYSTLEDKGRAAIVLPDNVLFDEKAIELWKYLMSYCNVHTILRLPNGTFTPYAQGVKANVVFFQKGLQTENVWIFDARTNIHGITKKDRPLTSKHFDEFEKSYGTDPNGMSQRIDLGINGRFRKFPISIIKENGYKLDITWLKDETIDVTDSLSTPQELALEAISELEAAIEDFKEVLILLENDNE